VALKDVDKSYAAIAGVIGVSSWALTLALPITGGGSPVLVYLSDRYVEAATVEQRAAFATAAEGLIAENNSPGLVGVLTTLGILLISLVMLSGSPLSVDAVPVRQLISLGRGGRRRPRVRCRFCPGRRG
jgi:hypothetical protein